MPVKYNILKISKGAEQIVHKAMPDISTAKTILHDMELTMLGEGEIIHSWEMAFAIEAPGGIVGEIYRIEPGLFA